MTHSRPEGAAPTKAAMRAAEDVSLILVRWQVAPESERLSAALLAASMAKAIDDATGLPELLEACRDYIAWDDRGIGAAMRAIAKAEGR